MRRLHVPEAWRQSAVTILQERPRVILVLGGGDAGKSSYCRFLVPQAFGDFHVRDVRGFEKEVLQLTQCDLVLNHL